MVAGGRGTRFGGDVPKQLLTVAGRRVLDWSLAVACTASDGVVVVLPADQLDAVAPTLEGADAVVAGGATRSASVRAGLAAVPGSATVVVVHDAARPAATPELFAAVVRAVRDGAQGAVPGEPVTDTIKRVEGSVVVETLERDRLVRVQTPQAFEAVVLRRAHAGEPEATDDAALVEAAGGTVVVVPGEATNTKVTVASDLDEVAAVLRARHG